MTPGKLTFLLQNPETIDALSTEQLDAIIHEFPYFQAVKSVQLKGFKNAHSNRYNSSLKKTAAYTIDRQILFEFITSPIFIEKNLNEKVELEEIEVVSPVEVLQEKNANLTQNEAIAYAIKKEAEEILEIGKPIEFTKFEPHSFTEWLQLTNIEEEEEENHLKNESITSKFDLIDRFIQSNPKIIPIDKNAKNIEISIKGIEENDSLMTETLAKVYVEQKKYDSAIKAYHILSLKYPEKSSFFANRIKAIKNLQNNKS